MQIKDHILKCVVFVACKLKDTSPPQIGGTAFLVGHKLPGLEKRAMYFVTAAHCIEECKKNAVDGLVHLRANIIDGSVHFITTDIEDWEFHPSDTRNDVAVCSVGAIRPEEIDEKEDRAAVAD